MVSNSGRNILLNGFKLYLRVNKFYYMTNIYIFTVVRARWTDVLALFHRKQRMACLMNNETGKDFEGICQYQFAV